MFLLWYKKYDWNGRELVDERRGRGGGEHERMRKDKGQGLDQSL